MVWILLFHFYLPLSFTTTTNRIDLLGGRAMGHLAFFHKNMSHLLDLFYFWFLFGEQYEKGRKGEKIFLFE